MNLPHLHGIVPPLPTPVDASGAPDPIALERLIEFQLGAGVHGLWILGTTARFDMIADADQQVIAETAAELVDGRVPLVLNVSDGGSRRTLERARRFDALPYDYYAALPPWYLPMQPEEVCEYFLRLADELSKPLVIYNAPWVCNQLSLNNLRRLANHPRIAGCKDVGPSLNATLAWPTQERRSQGFSYLAGTDNLDQATVLGADGFVSSLSNPFPELAVAIWDAARAGDRGRAATLQDQWLELAHLQTLAPMLACLEAACRHRGILDSMLTHPLRPLDAQTASQVVDLIDRVGWLPDEQQADSHKGFTRNELQPEA